jgi:predicted GIY-YIG superfamily endonuclease
MPPDAACIFSFTWKSLHRRKRRSRDWHRDWKIRLIEEDNSQWSDLSPLL